MPNTLERRNNKTTYLFTAWFVLLSFLAVYNFTQNLADSQFRDEQGSYMEKTSKDTATALGEHKDLRERIILLEGIIRGQQCSSVELFSQKSQAVEQKP